MFRFNRDLLRQWMLSPWIALALLLCGLQASFWMWMSARQHAEALQSYQFRQAVLAVEDDINEKIEGYRQTLKSVEQLYASSHHVTADEFKLFVDDYTEKPQDDGLRAIGFIKYIDLQRPETYRNLDISRSQLLKQVRPTPGASEFAPLLYIEPRAHLNQETLLQNSFAIPQLRHDLSLSGDSDRLIMSRQLIARRGAGALKHYMMQVPVYWGLPKDADMSYKRPYLNGWVF